MPNVEASRWELLNGSWAIRWGGSVWTLDHSNGRFGPLAGDGTGRRLLTIQGLAATGRREDGAFTADALVNVERLHSRVYATFAPNGWHGLTVRAAWGPSREGAGLDLEVQAITSSVGELEKLEIIVESIRGEGVGDRASAVEPRDRRSASLSYDGRERLETLRQLTTLPIPQSEAAAFAPIAVPVKTGRYFEMVHPHDAARRCVDTASRAITAVRYALFGFDLEKGVVLRGRLRGVWLGGSGDVEGERQRFLNEPPPLGVV